MLKILNLEYIMKRFTLGYFNSSFMKGLAFEQVAQFMAENEETHMGKKQWQKLKS